MHHISTVKLSKENQVKLIDTAKILSGAGVDVNIKDFAARTAIFQATKSENIPLIDFLISKGASCPESRAVDEKGENLLHNIVRMWKQGNMGEIVKKLAAKSQNTLTDLATTKSRIGYTPLLLAGKIMAEDSADVTLS